MASQIQDCGVSHSDSLATYAAAFFKISHSMRNLEFSFNLSLSEDIRHSRNWGKHFSEKSMAQMI